MNPVDFLQLFTKPSISTTLHRSLVQHLLYMKT